MATITTINDTDLLSASRTVINGNFATLNAELGTKQTHTTAATIPTSSGTAGERVYTSVPIAGGHEGWVCLGGTDWKKFGVIDL